MSSPPLTITQSLQEARNRIKQGDTESAKRLYEAVLARDPGNKKAKKGLKGLLVSGKVALTRSDFERVTGLLTAGRLDRALAEIRTLCSHHPQEPALHNLRGAVHDRRNEPEDAVAAFQRACQLEPAFSEAIGNMAVVLTRLERFDEALRCYQELADRGHLDADGYIALARALRGAGQPEKALEALKRALQLKPMSANAFNDLGNTLAQLGRHEDARQAYENALGIDPRHVKARRNLENLS